MIQNILIILTLSAAAYYLIRKVYLQFFGKKGKCSDCGMNGK